MEVAEGKLSADPPSPGPTGLSLLPSKRGRGAAFAREVVLPPTPRLMSLVEQVLLGGPASNLHT